MTQEEKKLLLIDLCARLPYGVVVSVQGGEFESYKYPYQLTAVSKFGLDSFCKVYHPIYTPFGGVPNIENVKPYLRPLSSMTKEEKQWSRWYQKDAKSDNFILYMYQYVEWLDSKHFDWRTDGNGKTLIELGLALEAPEGMYKTE